VLRCYLVILSSLGRVPSCRSVIRKPGISTGDTYTHRSWARSTYTRNGPHDTANTEGQGARVRPNMKLRTTVFCFMSFLLVLWRLWTCHHSCNFFYPLIAALDGHGGITYIQVHTQTHPVPTSIVMSGFYGHEHGRNNFFETRPATVPATFGRSPTSSFQYVARSFQYCHLS
jgi:hypothetical protein